jgi:Flp pilus assembly pilin Flp
MLHLLIGYNRMKEFFSKMGQREEKGQTLIEYALILALIVIVVIVTMSAIGTQIGVKYNQVSANLAAH